MTDTIPRLLLVLLLALGACSDAKEESVEEERKLPSDSPFSLVELGPASGLVFETRSGTAKQDFIIEVKSTGLGLLDLDADGLQDILLVAASSLERRAKGERPFGVCLYRNLGGLRFEDVTKAAGFADLDLGWTSGAITADIDGDGDDDLYLTAWGKNRLLWNEGGRFRLDESQLADEGWGTSAVFHDLDLDGDLDLYLCNYLDFDPQTAPKDGDPGFQCRWRNEAVMCGPKGFRPQADRVFENVGDGRFVDVTKAWGFADVADSFGLGVIAGDFDGDGSPEIYVANDGMANFHFVRDKSTGRYQDAAALEGLALSEDGAPQAGMGLDAADLNGDGLDDILCTNFSGEVNNLYLSSAAGFYMDASATSGLALDSLSQLGWGTFIRDIDLDGKLDLFVANGHVYPQAERAGTNTDYPQKNQLWLGQDDGRFAVLAEKGHPGLAVKKVSRGVVAADLDLDGDQDILVCNLNDRPTLIENRLDQGALGRRSISIRLRGPGRNTEGIGARVRLLTEPPTVFLEMRRNYSFQCSGEARIIFGLASSDVATEAEVRWPDGRREVFSVAAGKPQTLVHGKGRP